MAKIVVGDGGWRGELHAGPTEAGSTGEPLVLVRPEDGGASLLVPAELLVRQSDGTYYLPLARDAAAAQAENVAGTRTINSGERIVVPVVEETLSVGKRMVETGRVRVTKTVSETNEAVDEPLLREAVTVDRLSMNRMVTEATAPRQEGDTLIVPIYEEILVVEKRLVLREELHITRRSTVVHEPQTVRLRREQVHVERENLLAKDGSDGSGESTPLAEINKRPAV